MTIKVNDRQHLRDVLKKIAEGDKLENRIEEIEEKYNSYPMKLTSEDLT